MKVFNLRKATKEEAITTQSQETIPVQIPNIPSVPTYIPQQQKQQMQQPPQQQVQPSSLQQNNLSLREDSVHDSFKRMLNHLSAYNDAQERSLLVTYFFEEMIFKIDHDWDLLHSRIVLLLQEFQTAYNRKIKEEQKGERQ